MRAKTKQCPRLFLSPYAHARSPSDKWSFPGFPTSVCASLVPALQPCSRSHCWTDSQRAQAFSWSQPHSSALDFQFSLVNILYPRSRLSNKLLRCDKPSWVSGARSLAQLYFSAPSLAEQHACHQTDWISQLYHSSLMNFSCWAKVPAIRKNNKQGKYRGKNIPMIKFHLKQTG